MQILKTLEGDTLHIALEGRLDIMTTPELEAQIKDDIPTINSLVIDLEKLEYVSSAGLRIILSLHKSLAGKGGLILRNANDIVTGVFEVTGLTDVLTIE